MQSGARPVDPADPIVEPAAAPGDDRQAVRQALVDLEAARGRVERDAGRVLEATRAQLVTELLPVLDNLDRSIAASPTDDPMLQGVKQVRSQLVGVLQGYGLERFDVVGARFDPREHDAVAMVDVTERERDGTVVEQLEAGYRSGDRLLRPAKVAVGRYRPAVPHEAVRAEVQPEQVRPRFDVLREQERIVRAEQARRQAAAQGWAGVDPWDPWRGQRRR